LHKRSAIFLRQPDWYSNRSGTRSGIPADVASWIFETCSLTQRLKKTCGVRFRVAVVHQRWTRPWPDEARLLHLGMHQWALVREVQLFCHRKPLIVARTVIPSDTLKGSQRKLASLGTRPLGEVIFTYPGLRRHSLDIANVACHDWNPGLRESLDINRQTWGRRTVYGIGQRRLLVCEFFLPSVLGLG